MVETKALKCRCSDKNGVCLKGCQQAGIQYTADFISNYSSSRLTLCSHCGASFKSDTLIYSACLVLTKIVIPFTVIHLLRVFEGDFQPLAAI